MKVGIAIIALVAWVAAAWAQPVVEQQVSPTKYDYSQVAQQITAGCDTKYEQAHAIYRWLCDNISYDTSYSIYTADECWDNRRGVCQAYSELFYRLAEPLGLETIVVRGVAKPSEGKVEGHAWIFAIVEGENTGIMIDPTWGAGSVNGSTFTRNNNDDTWFHVDPYWLIFTHFPDDEAYQLLPQPVNREQFDALPVVKPMWGEYGFDAKGVFDRCMAGDTDLPMIYHSGVGVLRLASVPEQSTLRMGENYRFAIQKLQQCDVALLDGGLLHNDWQLQGNTYYMDYMPTSAGDLHLGFKQDGEKYATVVQYAIAQPTAADLKRLEEANPLMMPELTGLANFNAVELQKHGIDGKKLLAAVRGGSVSGLPMFYGAGDYIATDIPLNGTLRVGQSYTFTLQPRGGVRWAVINEKTWHRAWNTDPSTGTISMTVVPDAPGKLVVAVQLQDGGSYSYCLTYTVK